jgi:hypothetical protein
LLTLSQELLKQPTPILLSHNSRAPRTTTSEAPPATLEKVSYRLRTAIGLLRIPRTAGEVVFGFGWFPFETIGYRSPRQLEGIAKGQGGGGLSGVGSPGPVASIPQHTASDRVGLRLPVAMIRSPP